MSRRWKVFVSTLHPGDAISYLEEHADVSCSNSREPITKEHLWAELADKDAVVCLLQDKFDASVLAHFPNLKVVSNVAVGYDNINVPDATTHGLLVCNTPRVLDDTTADLAFGLLLATTRRIVEADRYVRDGKWQKWSFDLLLGTDLRNKTLGIIGMGRIGQAMARRAKGFDLHIAYTQRNRVPADVEQSLNARYLSIDELLSTSDFISIHCPLTADTRHLIGERQFSLMKDSAYLINTARGAVVDEKALVKALQSKQIKGAGLDVFENEPTVSPELITMPNVVLTPHIGSASVETRSAMARLAAEGVVNALAGKLPANAVNPEVWPKFLNRLEAAESRTS